MRLNPFGKPEDQQVTLVSSHPATHKTQFFRTLPWFAAKGGEVGTLPQLKARLNFARWMIRNTRGDTGTVTLPDGRRISRPAYEAMTEYPNTGIGAFGGMSPEERRSKRYDSADSTVKDLKKTVKERGGAVTAARRAAPE